MAAGSSGPGVDDVAARQRNVLLAVAVLVSAAMLPMANDAAMLGKFVVLVLGAVALVVLAAVGVVRDGRVAWARGPVLLLGLALGVVAALASLWSPAGMRSFVGAYGRYAGGLGYLASAVLLFGVVVTHRVRDLPRLAAALLAGSAVTIVYGLVQVAGADPLKWDNPDFDGRVLGTFGNPDFAAAMLAVGLPLAVWGLVRPGSPTALRVAGGALTVGTIAAIAGTAELQGWFAGLGGLVVLLLAWLLERPARTRRWALPALGVGVGLGVVVVTLDVLRLGPLQFISKQSTYNSRTLLWRTGWRQFTDAPLTGQGVDRYGDLYNAFRPVEEAFRRPLSAGSDAAHDVALNLFAGGGVLLGTVFVAFALAVGWALVVGLRETDGADRLLVGAFGGAWLAYQLQALVSIDIPPLLAVHALTAGGLLVVALPPERRVTIVPNGRRTAVAAVAGVLAVALALPTSLLALRMLRADLQVRAGQKAVLTGDVAGAAEDFNDAVDAVPWSGQHALLGGIALLGSGASTQVLGGTLLLRQALERNPDNLSAAVTLGRLAARDENLLEVRTFYDRAVAIEPISPALRVEYATALTALGDTRRAAQQLEVAVATGRTAIADGLASQTVTAFGAALDVADEPVVRLVLAEALLADGRADAAADALAEVEAVAPDLDGVTALRAALG